MRVGTIIILVFAALAWECIAAAMIGIGGGLLGTPVKSLEVAGWFLAMTPIALVLLAFMNGFTVEFEGRRE
ncbi:MAG: hypothetical protein KJ042_05650 [Deltaproteobacteria bacterium]|nr:hypothetical protein [Deltaproteobacteria bacterium]